MVKQSTKFKHLACTHNINVYAYAVLILVQHCTAHIFHNFVEGRQNKDKNKQKNTVYKSTRKV